jgi:hypothetical protein
LTDPSQKALRGPAPRLRLVLAVVGVAVLVLALALYASRKVIAREALTGWLKSRGIASEARIDAFGLSGATGSLRVGDPNNPDLTAARAEVRYGFKGLGVEVISVKLTRPVVRARLHDGKLSVGALDPLIEEFRRRPPRPDARKPRIEIDDGVLLLASDYGPVRLTADALVDNGKLMSLDATTAATRLRGDGFDASLGPAVIHERTRGDRVELSLDTALPQAAAGELTANDAQLRITAAAPYPDLQRRRGDGALIVRANLAGETILVGEREIEGAQLSAAFTGRTTGWIPDLTVVGQAVADLRAASGTMGGARAEGVRLAATSQDLRWTRKGGDTLSATLRLTGVLDELAVADLRLTAATGALEGPVSVDHRGAALRLTGSAIGHGDWSGLGAPGPLDSAEIAAVKRGLRGFRIAAPHFAITADRVAWRSRFVSPPMPAARCGWRPTAPAGGSPRRAAACRRSRRTSTTSVSFPAGRRPEAGSRPPFRSDLSSGGCSTPPGRFGWRTACASPAPAAPACRPPGWSSASTTWRRLPAACARPASRC